MSMKMVLFVIATVLLSLSSFFVEADGLCLKVSDLGAMQKRRIEFHESNWRHFKIGLLVCAVVAAGVGCALAFGCPKPPTPEDGEVVVDVDTGIRERIRGSYEYIGKMEFEYATIQDGEGTLHTFTQKDLLENGFDLEQGAYLRIDPDALLINGEYDVDATVVDVNYDFVGGKRFMDGVAQDVTYTAGEDSNTLAGVHRVRGDYSYDLDDKEYLVKWGTYTQ